MSAVDPFSRGSTLLTFRLSERASGSVWQAEDTRNGKKVAIKVLSRQLPKDAAKREAFVRDVRLGAAIYHPSLVNIVEVTPAGDALLMVMEWIDGQSISVRVRGKALDRAEFFRVAYQIVDGLRFLHAKNVVHGNVAGDSVLVLPSGRAKLCGLNLSNLVQRPGQPSAFQQKGSDPHAVAYMAPEQISNQPVTVQSDIFSLGLVLYEAATGRVAYQGTNTVEIAHKVVEEQPASPKSIDPNIDNAVLGVMGRCLFKDPFRRHKDTKAMSEEIARADPEAAKFAAEIAKGISPAAAKVDVRNSILFLADVANYALGQSSDPTLATKAASQMQQVLGEAVYLFDGEVLDPFGPRLIAALPSVEKAIEAGRKGEFDFSPAQQGETEAIPVRLLLHAGEVEIRDGQIGGAGVAKGLEVLQSLPPLKLHVSEEFLKKGRGNLRFRDIGARAGVKLYTIVEPEPQAEPEPEQEQEQEAEEAGPGEETPAAMAPAATKKKRNTLILAGAAAIVVVVGAGAGIVLLSKPKAPKEITNALPAKKSELPPATAATPRKILLQPFTVQGTDPALPARAEGVRLSAIDFLRGFSELQIADRAAPDVSAFTATVLTGTAGPEIATGANAAVPMVDAASGIESIVQFVTAQLHLPPHPVPSAEALNEFANAVAARAANDKAKTEAALRAAIKADPGFLAAQMMAMHFFTDQGKPTEALAAARGVLAADPTNVEAARAIARASLNSGDLATAFNSYAIVLKKDPNDIEALNILGRYAYGAADAAKFGAVLHRLSSVPFAAAIQQPDLLLAAGKIDSAVDGYYTLEESVQNNPALTLKIGRLAVLRHSTDIAELELKKLQDSDPNYGLHILKAYIAAQNGAKADADNELKIALAASKPGDDYWTNVAEVAVISGDTPGALVALKRAVDRKEPTGAYILSNPLFSFLADDPQFQKVKVQIASEQNEIRTALAGIQL